MAWEQKEIYFLLFINPSKGFLNFQARAPITTNTRKTMINMLPSGIPFIRRVTGAPTAGVAPIAPKVDQAAEIVIPPSKRFSPIKRVAKGIENSPR